MINGVEYGPGQVNPKAKCQLIDSVLQLPVVIEIFGAPSALDDDPEQKLRALRAPSLQAGLIQQPVDASRIKIDLQPPLLPARAIGKGHLYPPELPAQRKVPGLSSVDSEHGDEVRPNAAGQTHQHLVQGVQQGLPSTRGALLFDQGFTHVQLVFNPILGRSRAGPARQNQQKHDDAGDIHDAKDSTADRKQSIYRALGCDDRSGCGLGPVTKRWV